MNKIIERKKFNISQIILLLIFVLAFVLRIKTYLLARPLFHDECSLAANIVTRNIWEFFRPLDFDQKAPAIFMMLAKSATYVFEIKELSIKLISLLSGIFSVIIFYFLSKKVLNSKFGILASNFLFAINYQLIYWSQKFKQYSFDVCIFMLSILFFTSLDLDKISYKKCILYSFIAALLIMASFPCIFVVGAYVLYCILKKINFKKTLSFSLPLVIFSLSYYLKTIYTMKKIDMSIYFDYWEGGFLTFNLNKIITLLRENFNFFFEPNHFALIGIILFVFGAILFFKNRTKTGEIILLGFLGIILASFLQIYPIWQRMALYLLPVLILFVSKPLDLISGKKKMLSLIIIFLSLSYFSQYNLSYIGGFLKKNAFELNDAITIFPKLVEGYDNSDILVINSSTKADFIYYSQVYKFYPKQVVVIPIYKDDKAYYYDVLNSLPRGYDYWFIFGWEYSHKAKFSSIPKSFDSYVKEFHLKVLEKYEDERSLLVKVKF